MVKNNLKDKYFKKMKETSQCIYNEIVSLIKKEYGYDEELSNNVLLLVKRRQKKLLARPHITRLGYELAGGKNWKKIIPPGVLLELENISTYQSNAAFDSKYGVANNDLSKSNQVIASFLTRNLIQKEIENNLAKKEGLSKAREFSKIITEIDIFDYVGQYKELNYLGIHNFDFNMNIKDYLNIYLKIKYLYGGKWIRDLLLVGILFSEKKYNEKEKIARFGVYCGTPYTMINDLSDFCLSKVERGYKISIVDQFKDVWNGRVTLPLYYAISKYSSASKQEKKFLIDCMEKKHKQNLTNMKKILKILLKSGALDFSYSIINFLMRKARKIIKELPKSPERDMLILLNTSLRTNKFFYELRKKGMKLIEFDSETINYLDGFWENIIMRR